jgi:hypothetical protein
MIVLLKLVVSIWDGGLFDRLRRRCKSQYSMLKL